jgi:hypothetical protein
MKERLLIRSRRAATLFALGTLVSGCSTEGLGGPVSTSAQDNLGGIQEHCAPDLGVAFKPGEYLCFQKKLPNIMREVVLYCNEIQGAEIQDKTIADDGQQMLSKTIPLGHTKVCEDGKVKKSEINLSILTIMQAQASGRLD